MDAQRLHFVLDQLFHLYMVRVAFFLLLICCFNTWKVKYLICRKWETTLCLRHWWLSIDDCKDTKDMYNFIHTSKDRSWMHIWLILRSVTLQFTYTCHQHPNGFVLGEDPRTTWVTAASREYFSAVILTGNLGAVKKRDMYTSLNKGKPFTWTFCAKWSSV